MWLEKINQKNIILGSASPRRQELLKEMGIKFQVLTHDIDENFPNTIPPPEVAEYLSRLKIKAFEESPETVVITADTTVCYANTILNKPQTIQEAKHMLSDLQGKTHVVYSGVSIKYQDVITSFTDETKVTFSTLTADEIDYYIQHHQPFDKAGAYGIQEWIGMIGIEKIYGSYFK